MQKLKVLVIGGGGREHALAWKLGCSASVAQVFVAPGNGGTALDPTLINIDITSNEQLCVWAKANAIDLTVVGPEAPLASGVVDLFRANGLAIFGPTQAAAQLESSKAFSKAFMQRHGIPTAAFDTFTDAASAHAYIEKMGAPIVVKADGLAAGKGVVVASTLEQAHAAVDDMLGDNSLGVTHNADGARVVIEECLLGEEASFIVMVDGQHVVPMATSQDHKRLLNNDQGPNTGGMGAYSPAPVVTQALFDKAMDQIIWPTVRGMAKDGITFTGFLYAGLMIAPNGEIKTLEFNCRMGDPETQPILMRLKSDLGLVLLAGAKGEFQNLTLDWDERVALGVVLAAHGYPLQPRKGDAISGLPANSADCMVFHAGTALTGTQLLSSGGRVLCVTALADSVAQAQGLAYQTMRSIELDGSHYRTDIGARAL